MELNDLNKAHLRKSELGITSTRMLGYYLWRLSSLIKSLSSFFFFVFVFVKLSYMDTGAEAGAYVTRVPSMWICILHEKKMEMNPSICGHVLFNGNMLKFYSTNLLKAICIVAIRKVAMMMSHQRFTWRKEMMEYWRGNDSLQIACNRFPSSARFDSSRNLPWKCFV